MQEIILSEGCDLTHILKIEKYEPVLPAQLVGKIKGPFPQFLIKSDQLNLQTYPDVLKEIQGKKIFVTIKMDGCMSGETNIITEDGVKTAKEICETKYNGKVLSFDIENGKQEFRKIRNHWIQESNNDWYEVEIVDGKKIILTGNHKIWIPSLSCWRRVDQLQGNEDVIVNN